MNLHLKRWLFSTNAKDISILYFIFAIFAAMVGTSFSVLIRLELTSPGQQFLQNNGQVYNVIVTLHAIIMIFYFVMPSLIGGFFRRGQLVRVLLFDNNNIQICTDHPKSYYLLLVFHILYIEHEDKGNRSRLSNAILVNELRL